MTSAERGKKSRTSGEILKTACAVIKACDNREITLDDALDNAPETFRRTLRHLLFNFFRYRKFIEREIGRFCKKAPAAEVKNILMTTYTQCRFQNAIAPGSAVNIAVAEAKKFHAGGFVNAVMRRMLEDPPPLPTAAEEIFPAAVLARWQKRFSASELNELAKLFVSEAEFSFRILPGFEAPENSEPIPAFGKFRFASADAETVLNSETFKLGGFYIQDAATSLALSLAEKRAARAASAIDICAAPGGKTLMLSEILPENAELTASDISARRQQLTKENFELRKRKCRIISQKAEKISGLYDLVLADVPCSNTGVFRRRPDALWRFSETELTEVAALQKNIILAAAKLTAPGGTLIVSTCSIEPEENDMLVDTVLGSHPDFQCETSELLLPSADHDGAFAAVLTRSS